MTPTTEHAVLFASNSLAASIIVKATSISLPTSGCRSLACFMRCTGGREHPPKSFIT